MLPAITVQFDFARKTMRAAYFDHSSIGSPRVEERSGAEQPLLPEEIPVAIEPAMTPRVLDHPVEQPEEIEPKYLKWLEENVLRFINLNWSEIRAKIVHRSKDCRKQAYLHEENGTVFLHGVGYGNSLEPVFDEKIAIFWEDNGIWLHSPTLCEDYPRWLERCDQLASDLLQKMSYGVKP